MTRMRWMYKTDAFGFESGCGRFVVRTFCMDPKPTGYWSLYDNVTRKEYPCCSEGSAKSGARNILRQESL